MEHRPTPVKYAFSYLHDFLLEKKRQDVVVFTLFTQRFQDKIDHYSKTLCFALKALFILTFIKAALYSWQGKNMCNRKFTKK